MTIDEFVSLFLAVLEREQNLGKGVDRSWEFTDIHVSTSYLDIFHTLLQKEEHYQQYGDILNVIALEQHPLFVSERKVTEAFSTFQQRIGNAQPFFYEVTTNTFCVHMKKGYFNNVINAYYQTAEHKKLLQEMELFVQDYEAAERNLEAMRKAKQLILHPRLTSS